MNRGPSRMRNTDPEPGHEVGQRLRNLAVAALVVGAGRIGGLRLDIPFRNLGNDGDRWHPGGAGWHLYGPPGQRVIGHAGQERCRFQRRRKIVGGAEF